MTNTVYFQWQDYLVLAVVLLISAVIGFYYAFTGGKQKTTKEYLFADKNMHWFPVACSLVASYISSLDIIALPAEIYTFGTIWMLGYFFWPIGMWIASKFYLPVFHNLKVVSMFRYIELRFGKAVKMCVTWAALLNNLLFTGLVIYGPSISISVVTGLNLWTSVSLITGVSLLYTILGGMKAVLWADTLQLLIIFAGIITVFIAGVTHEGGFGEIYKITKLSGRFDVFEWFKVLSLDPRSRHTLWNMIFDGITGGIVVYGTTQTSVMRALSLPSGTHIIKTYSVAAFGRFIFIMIFAIMGLVIFSFNRFCDPIKNGEIFTKDQYYPLFVMKLFKDRPGLPGFILSAIFSGSLSTISSIVNAMATVLMTDIVRPWKPNMTDHQATIVTKVLSVVVGAISVVFVLFAQNFGQGLLSMLITITGIFGGPSLAVFSLGIFLPFVNSTATLVGFIFGSVYAGWTGLGSLMNGPYVYHYPVTTAGCNITNITELANISSPVYDPDTWNPKSHYREGVDFLYDVSYIWTKAGGIIVTSTFAIVISLILNRKQKHRVNHRLISPSVAHSKCLPKSWRKYIDYTEDESIIADYLPVVSRDRQDNRSREKTPSSEELIELHQQNLLG